MIVELLILRIAISAVYALLGSIVLLASPRATANRAFAAYALASALHMFFGFVVGPLGVPELLQHIIFAVFYLSLAAAVIMLANAFPERIRSGEARDEERDLFLIAGELGLLPVRAFELREEMEGKSASVPRGWTNEAR